jgi:hypothetical protein
MPPVEDDELPEDDDELPEDDEDDDELPEDDDVAPHPVHGPKPDPSLLQICAPIVPPAGWPGHAHATCAPGVHAGALPPAPAVPALPPPHAVGNMPVLSANPSKSETCRTGCR